MKDWFKSNLIGLIGLVLILLGGFASYVRIEAKVSGMADDAANFRKAIEDAKGKIDNHTGDTRRHIDPERDESRWNELVKRLERIEDKVDKIK